LEGLAKEEDVGIFNGHFVHFTAKWYILWPVGKLNFAVNGYIFQLLVCCKEKNLATLK
jgi:hypothetical protein